MTLAELRRWGPATRRATPPLLRDRPSGQERLLYGGLGLLAVIGLLSPGRFSAVPAQTVLEVVFVLVALMGIGRMTPAGTVLTGVGAGYVVLKALVLVFFSSASAVDFLQAYKAFVYVALLGALVGSGVFDRARLARFTTFLVVVFLVKYGYSAVLGLADRPGVYLENNFELVMLLGLFLLADPHLGSRRGWVLGALVVIVLLSGSRSAALGLLVVVLFLDRRTGPRAWPLLVARVALVVGAAAAVFLGRAQFDAGARLDRLNFLDTFRYEVQDWSVLEWLLGSPPLTPLTPGSCQSLSYYTPLFSSTDPGVCYSVILHSYVLRVVFDHGLLGMVLLTGLIWYGLRRSGTGRRETLALLTLIWVSGLSVSAFNNVFSAVVLAVAMGSVYDEQVARRGRRHRPLLRDRRARL
ncbi:hypothetical protein GB931_16155 [Modestobacter sp. I12A-02628]|uniref:Uncharacterized protein n=1 Tax=Goekera deserti TaxID=2497753 RepID=A0A7K3WIR5_9ACTN|nr:hypothetical protein [Goekera deserti]MPQ99423.1 hypothetical protein [Goekera deserti]NDI48910.1 hypothetical protein [Goekera deserti]NEL55620.1 hypothetical protein [Goekera deserti]